MLYSYYCWGTDFNHQGTRFNHWGVDMFGHKMTLSQELELKVDAVVSGTLTDYYEKLKKNLKYMGERLQKFRSQRLDMLNRNRQYHAFV